MARSRLAGALAIARAGVVGSVIACSSFSTDDGPSAAVPDPTEAGGDAPQVDPRDAEVESQGDAPSTKSYRELILDAKPLAYWRMGISTGDVIPDESGNGNTLELEGVTFIAEPG